MVRRGNSARPGSRIKWRGFSQRVARHSSRIMAARDIHRFLNYLEKQTIGAGEHLIRQGATADALYFVQSGEVTTVLELPGATPQRLRRQSSGTVVGELGLFLGVPRTASIVTNQVCSV